MFDQYMKWVMTERKALYDEYKKAGIIQDWSVFVTMPHGPHDPDVILCTTHANMAALDNLDQKTAAIDEKMVGSRGKGNDMAADREKLREIIGSELMRQALPPQGQQSQQ